MKKSLVFAVMVAALAAPAFAQEPQPVAPDTSVTPPPSPESSPAHSSPVSTPPPAAAPTPTAVPGAVAAPTIVAPEVSIDYIRPGRTDGEIRRDRERAAQDERDGNTRLLDEREKLLRAKSAVTVQENEIKILETRHKAAKQAKNAVDQKDLEVRIRSEKRKLSVLEKLHDVEVAQIAAAETAIDYARTVARLCDLENELLAKRGELAQWMRAGDASGAEKRMRLEKQVWDLETRVLESTRVRSTKLEDWAQKERNIANRKLDAYGAYSDLMKK